MIGATFRRTGWFWGIALALGLFFSFVDVSPTWAQKSGVVMVRPQPLFRAGDFYATQGSANVPGIVHYDAKGKLVGTIPVTYAEGSAKYGLHGLGFGPDGRLYVVARNFGYQRDGFDVLYVDDKGETHRVFRYLGPNASLGATWAGKIAFDKNNHLLVATFNGVVQFPLDGAEDSGKLLFTSDWIYGLVSLPSGKMLLHSGDKLQERAADGTNPQEIFRHASSIGVAYDASSNTIFASMAGSTADPNWLWPVIALDGTTHARKYGTNLEYGGDICVASDRRVVVTSTTQPVTIYDKDLKKIGVFDDPPQAPDGNSHCIFVIQKSAP